MEAEQIFYGRGDGGYTILGSSIPSCGVTDLVVELCQSVGTPGYERAEDNQPFLLQKVCGANVLMVCGRTGEADGIGRKTLFFHALVVRREYAREHGLSAADFYWAGKFSERCLRGKIAAVRIDDVKGASGEGVGKEFCFPAVFQCWRAANLGLIEMLAGRLVDVNWATMSWSVLKGFDWYGFDASRSSTSLPEEFWVYDVRGRERRCGRSAGKRIERGESAVEGDRAKGKDSGLKASLSWGVGGLVVGLVIGLMMGGDGDVGEKIVEKVEVETNTVEMVKEVPAEGREGARFEFDESNRILNFRKEMQVDGTYQSAMKKGNAGDPRFNGVRALFKKLEAYVEFVNKHFPKKENKEQEKEQKK